MDPLDASTTVVSGPIRGAGETVHQAELFEPVLVEAHRER